MRTATPRAGRALERRGDALAHRIGHVDVGLDRDVAPRRVDRRLDGGEVFGPLLRRVTRLPRSGIKSRR
jgi:predicted nucleotidyltransferase